MNSPIAPARASRPLRSKVLEVDTLSARRPGLALFSLFILLGGLIPAQEIADTQFDAGLPASLYSGVSGPFNKAQTITMLSDGLLSRVEIFINNNGSAADLGFNIVRTTGGVPDPLSSAIFSTTIPAAQIPTTAVWISVDVRSANISFTSGETLAIALSSPGGNFSWRGNTPFLTGPTYPGGQEWFTNAAQSAWGPTGDDLYFRTYRVAFPGTSDDFILATGINGPATTGGGNLLKRATAGDLLTVDVLSPGSAFDGLPYVLAVELLPTGVSPVSPLPFLHIDPATALFLVDYDPSAPVLLPPGGASLSLMLPPGLDGNSALFQAAAIGLNGIATTDRYEIRFVAGP